MRKFNALFVFTLILLFLEVESCKQKGGTPGEEASGNKQSRLPFDSALLAPFIQSHPGLARYEKDLTDIYRKYGFNWIWFDKNGVNESGKALYHKFEHLEEEGISVSFPYPGQLNSVFTAEKQNTFNENDAELMLSCLYLFYAENVYKGIDTDSISSMGWLVPLKEVSYSRLLDSIIADTNLLTDDGHVLFSQYYRLREALKRYRTIEKNGGWNTIELDPKLKAYKPNDTSKTILQIRERLYIEGELKQNNKSNRYDPDLVAAVKKFKLNNGYKADSLVKPEHIRTMNIPVSERIKTIRVNMERCRWLSPEIFNTEEVIFVNIPSYRMILFRNSNIEFDSPAVVGSPKTKTVIFSGTMSYLIFSPNWHLPRSIIEKEIKPAIAKDTNYMAKHNMEWINGLIRQNPGRGNSLGLVKFMFPNPHDIYFHDTPSKSHFKREYRALSHGCIRVGKPRELALTILKDNKTWTPAKIDAAMNGGKETICTLKNKIPVYILYFTAWVDEAGIISFYKDVYDMDERLAKLLIHNGNSHK